MAKHINPTYYKSHSCFRARKTINGKEMTFLGGHGAFGKDDHQARLRASAEITEKIRIAQLSDTQRAEEDKQRVRGIDDFIELTMAKSKHEANIIRGDETGDPQPPSEIMEELRQLREETALQKAQIAAVGHQFKTESRCLKDLQEAYALGQKKEGQIQEKTLSTLTYYNRSSKRFVEFLAENGVTTTSELDQSASVVAAYRDQWIHKISEGKRSHSTARKSLLGARQFVNWMAQREYISRIPPSIGSGWTDVGVDEVDPVFFTVLECQQLYKNAPQKFKLPILLGLNCGYREVDIQSLKREYINLKDGVILRQRHKGKKKIGKPQAHKLWPLTLKLLTTHLDEVEGEPFAKGYSNLSNDLTEYIKGQVPQDPEVRTAKNLRSTGSEELGKIVGSQNPRIVSQYLAQGDMAMAKHYRNEDTAALFAGLEKLGVLFGIEE